MKNCFCHKRYTIKNFFSNCWIIIKTYISTECKNKSIPVNVTQPRSYGTFAFPRMVITDEVVLSVTGTLSADTLNLLQSRLQELLPDIVSGLNEE